MIFGKLFLIIGPSGVGKGTVIRLLREKYPNQFVFPVSATTRLPRPGEKDGETYHFLSESEFQERIRNEEFLEWAYVHGKNSYGTLKQSILDALQEGKNVVRELDIQGFESIAREEANNTALQNRVVSIFLLPPSLEILKERIRNRAPISPEELEKRLESAARELEIGKNCTYQIQTIDQNIRGTFERVEEVIKKELKI